MRGRELNTSLERRCGWEVSRWKNPH